MANALPVILAGGAALLLMGGKKKKPADSGKELPDVTGEPADSSGGGTPAGGGGAEPAPAKPGVGEPAPSPGIPIPDKPVRPLGPSGAGSCANEIYRRDAVYLDGAVAERLSTGALNAYAESGYYFYIRHEPQEQIFDAALKTFASMAADESPPTVRSVVLREILNGLNLISKCDWDVPVDEFDKPMRMVWDDSIRLLTMAMLMVGHTDPHSDGLFKTGKRYTMPREPLGVPDLGYHDPAINQRMMILATDKSLQNAEHLIGRVTKLSGPNGEPGKFEIRIVDTFRGEDVRPQLTKKHGFKDMSNAYFSKSAPTGIYRFYPEGTV